MVLLLKNLMKMNLFYAKLGVQTGHVLTWHEKKIGILIFTSQNILIKGVDIVMSREH